MRSSAVWLIGLLLGTCSLQPCVAVIGWEYAVIIDAGSTGSRVHVFKFYRHKDFPYATVELPDAVHTTTPGLSSYSFDPRTGANSLAPLIKFAKEQVPEPQWPQTPVQLLATAGLRMLPGDASGALLQEARRLLGGSGFLFRDEWARVISGQEEGLFGWVSINYATGALQSLVQQQQKARLGRKELPGGLDPVKPTAPLTGVLELGGGSLQVTFAVAEGRRIPPNQAAPLEMPGLAGRQLYSHSFDGFGLQAAMAKHRTRLQEGGARADPCLPSGFKAEGSPAGSGDWEACKAAARKLLPTERCTFSSCSLGNVFTPPVEGPLIGIDNFFWSARALQLKPGLVQVNDYEAAAKRFCAKGWGAIRKEFLKHSSVGSDTYALQVCFAAAHVLNILRDGLHIGNASAALTLTNEVGTPKGGSFSPTWTLGALMVEVLGTGGRGSEGGPLGMKARGGAGEGGGGAGRLLSAPKTEAGAALLAGAFCLGLIVATVVASRLGVGVIAPSGGRGERPPVDKTRSLIPLQLEPGELAALIPSAALSGGGGGTGGGAGAHAHHGAATSHSGRVSVVGSSRRRGDGS